MLWPYDFTVQKNLERAEDLYHIVQQISLAHCFLTCILHLFHQLLSPFPLASTWAYLDQTIWRQHVTRSGVGRRRLRVAVFLSIASLRLSYSEEPRFQFL